MAVAASLPEAAAEGTAPKGVPKPGASHGRAQPGLRRLVRISLLMMPTILTLIYYGLVAADRYVSEAQFVVRTASKPVGAGAFGTFLQMSGLARASDDAFAVESYIGSRDAIGQLLERIPLREIYEDPSADFISRYPSIFYGSSLEELHRYMKRAIHTSYSSTSGITTLRVEAFRAEHAKAIADELLKFSEQMVNKMNERIQNDAIKTSIELVKDFEQRMINAQLAITRFRNEELMIDPISSSVVVSEVIGRLTADRAATETQISEMSASAPSNPGLAGLRRRVVALEDAILTERRKISDGGGGLANKLADYERLVLEREFAKTGLASATKGLEQARTEARRQQLYIEHVVRPHLPDEAMQPARLLNVWTVACLNIVGLLLGWLFYSGIREHAA